jgi:hypothetical protein
MATPALAAIQQPVVATIAENQAAPAAQLPKPFMTKVKENTTWAKETLVSKIELAGSKVKEFAQSVVKAVCGFFTAQFEKVQKGISNVTSKCSEKLGASFYAPKLADNNSKIAELEAKCKELTEQVAKLSPAVVAEATESDEGEKVEKSQATEAAAPAAQPVAAKGSMLFPWNWFS